MHKLVVLYPPQPDAEAFARYYRERHIPLVDKLPGLKGYRYSLSVEGIGGPTPYSCIFEADFEDGAALGAAMASAEGQRLASDVANFAEVAPTLINYPVEGGQ